MKAKLLVVLLVLVCCVVLAGCVPGGGHFQKETPAGFFAGVWHGWIAPVTLVLGLFDEDVRIYELNNTGWWYDFGFYVAVIGGFGGISLTRSKLKGKAKNNA